MTKRQQWDRMEKLGRKLHFTRPGEPGFETLAEEYMDLRLKLGLSPWPESSDAHAASMRRMLMAVRRAR